MPWGRGIGKSWFTRLEWYLLVAERDGRIRPGALLPGVRITHLMPTLKQAKKVHAELMLAELSPAGMWGFLGADINRTDWRITFPGGSWIQWVSAENIHDNRGIRCDVVTIDEADDVDIEAYESVVGPWFSEPHSLKMTLIGGTPRRGRYGLLYKAHRIWPKGDAEHEPIPGCYSFHATAYDAPELVDPALVDRLRKQTDPTRFAREWMCDFDSGEGIVYPMFDADFHVREPDPQTRWEGFIVGVDYGFVDPNVFLVIGYYGKGRQVVCHVLHEDVMPEVTASYLADVARRLDVIYPKARWFADNSEQSKTLEIKRDAGVRIESVEKGAGSVENGVAFVADLLVPRERETGERWCQLYVSPRCKRTIEEFGLYRRKRDPKNKERVLDAIDQSQNDHCMDALRYALTSHFGGPDRRIVTGYGCA